MTTILTEGGLAIGEKIGVDENYLSSAIDLFEANLILIGSELWKNLEPENEKRPDILVEIAFEHMIEERWRVAESLSYFMKEDKRTPEKLRLIGQMNYWQAVKWQGRYEDIRKEVEGADLSAKDEVFQLAQLALANKNESFFRLLPRAVSGGKLALEHLEAWPIFREMRQDEKYQEFREKNKNAFEESNTLNKKEGEEIKN